MVVAAGADFMKLGVSNCIQLGMLEHPARLNAQAAIATTRFMANTVHSCSPTAALHDLRARGERHSIGKAPAYPGTVGIAAGTGPLRPVCPKYGK
jgi:hypothetical protein